MSRDSIENAYLAVILSLRSLQDRIKGGLCVLFEFKDLEEKVKSHQQEMAELENNINGLIANQKELQVLNDDIEQYTRRTNIRIFGIHENKHEKTDELAKQFCKDELKIELKDDDISRSQRVGRTSYATAAERRPRPIIVRLTRHNKKVEILKKRRVLRQNHRNYSIQEDLTETRRSVLKYLRDPDIRDIVDTENVVNRWRNIFQTH